MSFNFDFKFDPLKKMRPVQDGIHFVWASNVLI